MTRYGTGMSRYGRGMSSTGLLSSSISQILPGQVAVLDKYGHAWDRYDQV